MSRSVKENRKAMKVSRCVEKSDGRKSEVGMIKKGRKMRQKQQKWMDGWIYIEKR